MVMADVSLEAYCCHRILLAQEEMADTIGVFDRGVEAHPAKGICEHFLVRSAIKTHSY